MLENGIPKGILEAILSLENTDDAVIIDALRMPDEYRHGGYECRNWKRDIQRNIKKFNPYCPVTVLWTPRGECVIKITN
jgi:hypothetical protein